MSFRPVTVYAIACDASDCDRTYQYLDLDDDREYETHLLAPVMGDGLRRLMSGDGWLVGSRDLCPEHAQAAGDAAVERLEIEVTHEPLFDVGGPSRPGAAGCVAGPAARPLTGWGRTAAASSPPTTPRSARLTGRGTPNPHWRRSP